jgi:hypothetical protein
MIIMLVHYSRCERNNAVCGLEIIGVRTDFASLMKNSSTVPLTVYCIECRFGDRTRDIHPGGSLGSDGF